MILSYSLTPSLPPSLPHSPHLFSIKKDFSSHHLCWDTLSRQQWVGVDTATLTGTYIGREEGARGRGGRGGGGGGKATRNYLCV